MRNQGAPLHLFLVVLGLVFFAIGAGIPYAEPWPWRLRFVSAGLFCVTLSTFF